ncbi:MAG: lipid A deacylase LpxR family protein [Polaribacter sp.]|nr:lipid A deacylase LpxR family protein [Polaribacter sp.]
MKYWLNFSFILFCCSILSQEKFSKEISFITENDLYVSTKKDRYYTNGVFLSYRYLSKTKKDNQEKRILEWQIGHEMYSPYKAIVQSINEHDRPFASYLFGSFGVHRVYKNDKIFNTTFQIGVIGPNAFGKELQDFIHDLYGFRKATGWEYQIKNALGLNLNTEYAQFLVKDSSNQFDITWVNAAKLGTIYTNISSGFYARVGLKPLVSIVNSMAFKTNLNNETTNFHREIESFFYIKPIIRYTFYDATLQGSFLNTSSLVTKELVPLVFHIEAGLNFTNNRYNFGYVFHFSSNTSKELRNVNGNIYGTIFINYLLH